MGIISRWGLLDRRRLFRIVYPDGVCKCCARAQSRIGSGGVSDWEFDCGGGLRPQWVYWSQGKPCYWRKDEGLHSKPGHSIAEAGLYVEMG